MSLTDLQLYANNAKSTLLLGISNSDLVLRVQAGHGARFPSINIPSVEFFLLTLESSGIIEVVRVTARTGDLLTIERGQEGTTASPFPLGAQVQMRVTRDTLAGFARLTDRMGPIGSVDDLPLVTTVVGNSFICDSIDDAGNPIVAIKAATRWKFLTHGTIQVSGSATDGTTTSLTSAVVGTLAVSPGRYIINFTSGSLAGTSRLVTSASSGVVTWTTPTAVAPAVGTNYEILVSNAYQLSLITGLSDESIINAIIFGS